MTGNNLRGKIPMELGLLDQLKTLRLNMNRLTGLIPSLLENLSSLQYLLLNDNQLTGPIPSDLGKLRQLLQLGLSDNQLTGSIPAELGKLELLLFLDLQNNRLTGPIPSALGQLTNLIEVGISGNRLTNCLPSAWSELYDHNTDFDKTALSFCGASAVAESVESSGEFYIEVVFLDNHLTRHHQDLVRQAAARWERVIYGDVPDVYFSSANPYARWLRSPMNETIRVSDPVDDLRVFIAVRPMPEEVMGEGALSCTGALPRCRCWEPWC